MVTRAFQAKAWPAPNESRWAAVPREPNRRARHRAREHHPQSGRHQVDMTWIHHDPDEAALIAAFFFAPAWIFKATTAFWRSISAAQSRAGVCFRMSAKAHDLTRLRCGSREVRHADEEKLNGMGRYEQSHAQRLMKRARRKGSTSRHLSASRAREKSKRMEARERGRTCPVIGKAHASTCRLGSPKPSRLWRPRRMVRCKRCGGAGLARCRSAGRQRWGVLTIAPGSACAFHQPRDGKGSKEDKGRRAGSLTAAGSQSSVDFRCGAGRTVASNTLFQPAAFARLRGAGDCPRPAPDGEVAEC